MARVPARVAARLAEGLKRYQPIVESAKSRDITESDTSRIVTDILADLFGYDKFVEITSEYCIRGTYCDLAIKLNDKPRLFIEVKSVGTELKDQHIKQAVDYAVNQGLDWVVLTNAVTWRIFKLAYAKPVDKEEVATFDFCALSNRNENDIALLYLLAKEGLSSSALSDWHAQMRAVNRFVIGAILQTEPVLRAVRREVARLSPDVRVSSEDICNVIVKEVLKREILDAPEAKETAKRINRELARIEKRKAQRADDDENTEQTGTGDSEGSASQVPTEMAEAESNLVS